MKQTRPYLRCLVAVVCLAVAIGVLPGCNRYPDRASVSGEVKFADGKPIAAGMIEFDGLDQKLTTGAPIQAGQYFVPQAHGLKAGKYRVRIYAPETAGAARAGGPPGASGNLELPKDLVPPRYNLKSKLEVNVADTKSQTFNFTIEGAE